MRSYLSSELLVLYIKSTSGGSSAEQNAANNPHDNDFHVKISRQR